MKWIERPFTEFPEKDGWYVVFFGTTLPSLIWYDIENHWDLPPMEIGKFTSWLKPETESTTSPIWPGEPTNEEIDKGAKENVPQTDREIDPLLDFYFRVGIEWAIQWLKERAGGGEVGLPVEIKQSESGYWLAVYENIIANGETREEAIDNFYKLLDQIYKKHFFAPSTAGGENISVRKNLFKNLRLFLEQNCQYNSSEPQMVADLLVGLSKPDERCEEYNQTHPDHEHKHNAEVLKWVNEQSQSSGGESRQQYSSSGLGCGKCGAAITSNHNGIFCPVCNPEFLKSPGGEKEEVKNVEIALGALIKIRHDLLTEVQEVNMDDIKMAIKWRVNDLDNWMARYGSLLDPTWWESRSKELAETQIVLLNHTIKLQEAEIAKLKSGEQELKERNEDLLGTIKRYDTWTAALKKEIERQDDGRAKAMDDAARQ